jgi:hypothetical protein
MARRQIKMLARDRKGGPGEEVVDSVSQECRPELGRYLLQVDKPDEGVLSDT